MRVIRGESVKEVALLSSTGELMHPKGEDHACLVEEECRKAFQRGEEKGEKIGYHKAVEESKVFLDQLQMMARKILELKNRLLDQLKPEIVEFTLAVCERVIRKELSQPQALVRLINSLLVSATPSLKNDTIQIVLSPDDFVILEKSFTQIQYDKREIAGIRFVADPLMRRGDCRIETKTGLLNYDISRELADLQSKVLQR
ncbi:MAG: hypothetical protein JJU12_07610 [Chlamydiales bacterium]|nr:hypothetical protein [Chlamydiales bacterium]